MFVIYTYSDVICDIKCAQTKKETPIWCLFCFYRQLNVTQLLVISLFAKEVKDNVGVVAGNKLHTAAS